MHLTVWKTRPRLTDLPPLAAVALVVVLDVAQRSWAAPVPVAVLMDAASHLLGAYVLACALLPRRPLRRLVGWAVTGAVAMCAVHWPLHLRDGGLADQVLPAPAPSIVTGLTLVCLAVVPSLRRVALGLAVGVALHLVRDTAAGPGVPLLWPLTESVVLVPYPWYTGLLLVAGTIGALRWYRDPLFPGGSTPAASPTDGRRPPDG